MMKDKRVWSLLFLVCVLKVQYVVGSSTAMPGNTTESTTDMETTMASTEMGSTGPVTDVPTTTTQQMTTGENITTAMETTQEQTTQGQTTAPTTTMEATTVMPTLGVSCSNDSSCMAANSSCYMNETCKCDSGFLQVSPTNCSSESALKVMIKVDSITESEIRISWDPPLPGIASIASYYVMWIVGSTNVTNSTQITPPESTSLLIMVDVPGEEVMLSITVVANDTASDEKNFTTDMTLTASPAMPMFNYTADDIFGAPTQNITWTQRGFFDAFSGNVTDKDGMVVDTFTTRNTHRVLKNLKAGMMYNLTLRAMRNSVYGMPAELSFTTSADMPGPPESVVLYQAGQKNFTLNVTKTGMPNGMLQGYVFKLQKRLYEDLPYEMAQQDVIRSLDATGLYAFNMDDFGSGFIVPGASYMIEAFSTNEKFNSSGPTRQTFQTLEAAPGNVSNPAIWNNVVNVAILRWNRPSMPNGVIRAYHLVVRSGMECKEYRVCIGPCGQFPISECPMTEDITNLTERTPSPEVFVPVSLTTEYNATIKAYTNVGAGPEAVLMFTSRILTPGAVQNLNPVTTLGTDSVMLSWNAPAVYPGPTRYTVMIKSNVTYSGVSDPAVSSSCTNTESTTCTVSGLQAYWRYSAIVMATTDSGSSTTTKVFTSEVNTPGAVTDVQLVVYNDQCQQFLLSWRDPPLEQRNSFIRAYNIFPSSGEKFVVSSRLPTSNVYDQNRNTYNKLFTGLEDGTSYSFRVQAIGNDGPTGSRTWLGYLANTQVRQVDCGASAGTIVGIIFAFILILLIALGIIFFIYRRKLKDIEERYRPQHNNVAGPVPVAMDPVQEEIERQRRKQTKRPFLLSEAQKVFEKMSADSNRLFSLEYEDLKKLSPKLPTEAANMEGEYNYSGNKAKNRYVNILPFDHSRVTLTPIDEDRCSDYINANYIPGYTYEREFIASQGPLEGTVDDFWRMVWEKSVSIIIMLTKCKEGNADKCAHYWPYEVNEPRQYGDIVVNVISVSNMDKFDINIFHVTMGDYTRTVKHFQFLDWPDFSANVETGTIIDFVQTVRTHITPEMKGPAIVHCSAGVGRTGTYITIDYSLQFVRDNDFTAEIDIFDWVLRMRRARCSMVQVEKQYIFIHMALLDLIERKKKGLIQDDRDDGLYINNEIVYENTAFEGDHDDEPEDEYENCEKEKDSEKEQPLTEL